jgi:hypothetical protein
MNNLMSRIFIVTAILVWSHPAEAQKVGSSSMQFLKVMPCARATAMGDAYSVLASGAEAVFWNPAGVAFAQQIELSTTYIQWIFDTKQAALSIAVPISSAGAIGIQLQYVNFGEIEEAVWVSPYNESIDFPGLTGRVFTPYGMLVGVSYGTALTDKFTTGVSVKYGHESLYNGEVATAVTATGDTVSVNTWADGIIFDFGLNYDTGYRTIRLAASMQNFGANVTYAQESNPVPMSLRVGIAADLLGNNALLLPSEDSRLGIAFDLFQPNDYGQQAHLGVEYEFAKTFSIRLGNKFSYDAEGFTAGLGLQQALDDTKFSLDYSFAALGYNLGNVHRISIGAKF